MGNTLITDACREYREAANASPYKANQVSKMLYEFLENSYDMTFSDNDNLLRFLGWRNTAKKLDFRKELIKSARNSLEQHVTQNRTFVDTQMEAFISKLEPYTDVSSCDSYNSVGFDYRDARVSLFRDIFTIIRCNDYVRTFLKPYDARMFSATHIRTGSPRTGFEDLLPDFDPKCAKKIARNLSVVAAYQPMFKQFRDATVKQLKMCQRCYGDKEWEEPEPKGMDYRLCNECQGTGKAPAKPKNI